MGCRLVQAATLAAFIHIVFTSEVIAQDPTDLDKDDVPGRMLTFSGRYDRDRKHFYDRWRIGRADWSCLVLYSLNRRFKKQLPEIEYAGLVQRN